jgi:hypothetical protein
MSEDLRPQSNFVKESILYGGKLSIPCKFRKEAWFDEVLIYYSSLFKEYVVSGICLTKAFKRIQPAVDYFTTIAFSEHNLAHLYEEVGYHNYKYDFCVEELEFMTNDEFEVRTESARIEVAKNLSEICEVHDLSRTYKDGLALIWDLRKGSHDA